MGIPNHFIAGTDFRAHDQGAYATTFADRQAGRLIKLYRAPADGDREHVVGVYEAELEAYKIAQSVEALKELTPTFHGQLSVEKVDDVCGTDVSALYLLDCAIELEFVPSPFQKIGDRPGLRYLCDEFHRHGIVHMSDASVAELGDGGFKLIDFAVREIERWWPD
jgi:hypothetical protein